MAKSKFITPGVYISEQPTFSNSVLSVPTAIPVFIGFTEKATHNGKDVCGESLKISSFREFKNIYGNAPEIRFAKTKNGMEPETVLYRLYGGVKWFYENGGRDCYIFAVGFYDYDFKILTDISPFTKALDTIEKSGAGPTLVVIPDAILLKTKLVGTDLATAYQPCYQLQNKMIDHCGKMQDRFAILDVPGGFSPEDQFDPIKAFRDNIQPINADYVSYAAAYYPYMITDVIDETDFSKAMFEGEDTPQKVAILEQMNLMAPSSAMAGIYARVDNVDGVWKAPANVSITIVKMPAIAITDLDQQDLNVPIDGKSICAIREFSGRGVLVWGARTLAGNSLDWRYIPVRRTVIYIEQSLQNAIQPFVFESNDANTWITVKTMAENFLMEIWKKGGLVGSIPSDAFAVNVGLGTTMTANDILNGIMRIQIMIALTRPAEFIFISLEQKMQQP